MSIDSYHIISSIASLLEYKVEYVRSENLLNTEWHRPSEFNRPAVCGLHDASHSLAVDLKSMREDHVLLRWEI
jgi:hypothetical protein